MSQPAWSHLLTVAKVYIFMICIHSQLTRLCVYSRDSIPSIPFYLPAETDLVSGIPLTEVRESYFCTVQFKMQMFGLIKSSV